jgi:hypothetical protein
VAGRSCSRCGRAPAAAASPFCVKLTQVGYGSHSFMYHRDIPSM